MGGSLIRISTVGANQAIHHELERARHLIPMDRGHDHDPVRSYPPRIQLVHPILRLAEVMIRITTARPVTERHRGRNARFAWVNDAAVFCGQHTEIEEIDFKTFGRLDYLFGRLCDAKRLRYLARAGLICARRSADEQNARRRLRRFVSLLGLNYRLPSFQPLTRQFMLGISKARSRLPCPRRLT